MQPAVLHIFFIKYRQHFLEPFAKFHNNMTSQGLEKKKKESVLNVE